MSAQDPPIGELVIVRKNGEPVVERADRYVLMRPELHAELGGAFIATGTHYRLFGPSAQHPPNLIYERIAPSFDPVGPAAIP